MSTRRVPLWQQPRSFTTVEDGATRGAVIGRNVWNDDGSLFEPAAAATPAAGNDVAVTLWRLVREIPPNVTALAETATTGLYVVTGDGTSATRAIQPVAGETTVADGDGIAGNPAIGLADVTPTAGGTLQKTAFDAKGRRSQEDAATTDDLTEGTGNLYFTAERAIAAVGGVSGGEILVQDGASAPPVMLTNEAQDDFIYSG